MTITAENLINLEPGTLAAVQSDDWMFGPDGQQYRVAFGPVSVIRAKDILGFEPKNSANWFVQVGYGDKAVLIAGCRVHYAMLTQTKPVGTHVYDAR